MKACFPSRRASICSKTGFSLLELLVVIGIIGLLAGVVYPATMKVLSKAKERRATHMAMALHNAIDAYVTEYRKLPLRPGEMQQKDVEMESGPELMDALTAAPSETNESGLNPRSITFFVGRTARPMGQGRYANGVRIDENGSCTLFDEWGERFRVRLDSDSNGRVQKPAWDKRDNGSEILQSILTWSPGPDKDPATGADNIKTW
ncbi:MAG: prepilin-type N-terminal cleavage/methylation domain-containing protein [Verrucomicrobiales bacterium]|nr:prepilin-type N-terminal cleavage/methylation domain-containing protein [Verrucomicrobiales bacterium]